MSLPGGKTLYKKQEGFLTLSPDQTSIIWGPRGATPTYTIAIGDIANLQQTPATSAKVILKIIVKNGASETTNHLFQFTSADARAEADAVKTLMSKLMADIKTNDLSIPRPSATPSFASASPAKPTVPRWMDDNALKQDIGLQQSLMKKDSTLHVLYMEGRASKGDGISDAAWNSMFWSQRTDLLRAHAIETEQRKGFVNILSVVKPKTQNGELKLEISVEQTQQIFEQHPVVRRIYDEFVPKKLNQSEFWSRFFLSRLSKKLRGERITDSDTADLIFDRFLDGDNFAGITTRIGQGHVPHAIDIEGNEENRGGFKGGNRPDVEMQPGKKNADLVATINSVSAKIMANVAPTDPMRLEEIPGAVPEKNTQTASTALQGELLLQDLQDSRGPESILLRVKDQGTLVSGPGSDINADLEDDEKVFRGRTPAQVLADLRGDTDALASGNMDIHMLIGINNGSDSDSGDEEVGINIQKKRPAEEMSRVGSKRARHAAYKRIIQAIYNRRLTEYGSQDQAVLGMKAATSMATAAEAAAGSQKQAAAAEDAKADKRQRAKALEATAALSADMETKTALTHSTCVEFLRQFWSAFRSGDADRAGELEGISHSLRRSKERILALAQEAENERITAYKIEKAKARELYKKTGQKIYPEKDACPGGREAVLGRFQNMMECLDKAVETYVGVLEREGLRLTVEE